MKKNILKVAFVAAIALVSGVNVFNSQKNVALSDVALANVEALSMDEVISGFTGPAETYDCITWGGLIKGRGVKCKSENQYPCSVVTCD